MTIQALDNFGPEWWTPESEAEAAEPASFKIRGLNGFEQADLMLELGADMQLTAAAMLVFFKYGVSDWRGIVDNDGAPIPFPHDAKSALSILPYAAQAQLARRLFELTFATAEDKKKSG